MKKVHHNGVLAAFYSTILGRDPLIHSWIEGKEKTMCERIKISHLVDYDYPEPTCLICKKRFERMF